MREKYSIQCPHCKETIFLTIAKRYVRSEVADEIMRQTEGLRKALVECKKQLKANK